MALWHLMSWEQARMKLIDGQAITNPILKPDYLMLVRPGSALDADPNGANYTPTQQDLQRNDWEVVTL